jgi:hypothetical protein
VEPRASHVAPEAQDPNNGKLPDPTEALDGALRSLAGDAAENPVASLHDRQLVAEGEDASGQPVARAVASAPNIQCMSEGDGVGRQDGAPQRRARSADGAFAEEDDVQQELDDANNAAEELLRVRICLQGSALPPVWLSSFACGAVAVLDASNRKCGETHLLQGKSQLTRAFAFIHGAVACSMTLLVWQRKFQLTIVSLEPAAYDW